MKLFFRVKILLKFFDVDLDPGFGIFDPGSGMEKFSSSINTVPDCGLAVLNTVP
jgi:hypothetical protein